MADEGLRPRTKGHADCVFQGAHHDSSIRAVPVVGYTSFRLKRSIKWSHARTVIAIMVSVGFWHAGGNKACAIHCENIGHIVQLAPLHP